MDLKKIKNRSRVKLYIAVFLLFLISINAKSQIATIKYDDGLLHLTEEGASYFAKLSLACASNNKENMSYKWFEKSPEKLWPSFYGCFDWHSSVHNHWALVKLLKKYPQLPEGALIKSKLATSFSKENIEIELTYLKEHDAGYFEFPYGQSWELKLVEELMTWDDPMAKVWVSNLKPLTQLVVNNHLKTWPLLASAKLSGSHDSPALGLSFALDYARTAHDTILEGVIISSAKKYYSSLKMAPIEMEPINYDFMSGSLLVVDLMRKIYSPKKFYVWLKSFAPNLLKESEVDKALAIKEEESHIDMNSHWDGFHLNRIWCLRGALKSLPSEKITPSLKSKWINKMNDMWNYSQKYIGVGNYDNDHWLSSFSVFAMLGYE